PFEYNFYKLNTKLSSSDETKQFSSNADKLFGRWPSPTIVLADDIADVEPIRVAIRRQDAEQAKKQAGKSGKERPVIGQIATIWDLLPGPPDVQGRKLALIAQIRKLTHDPALEVLTEKERADLAQVNPPETLRVLGPMD